MSAVRGFILACGLLTLLGCSPKLQSQAAEAAPKLSMSLRLQPQWLFEGQAVRVTCYDPDPAEKAWITLDTGMRYKVTVPHDRKQHIVLIENAECGTWPVTCAREEPLTKARVVTAELVVKGRCNDGR